MIRMGRCAPRTTSRPLVLSSWIVPARWNSALTITPPAVGRTGILHGFWPSPTNIILPASCAGWHSHRAHEPHVVTTIISGGIQAALAALPWPSGNVSLPFCPRPPLTRVFGSGRHYSTAASRNRRPLGGLPLPPPELETLLRGAQMWPTFNQLIAAATGRSDYGACPVRVETSKAARVLAKIS